MEYLLGEKHPPPNDLHWDLTRPCFPVQRVTSQAEHLTCLFCRVDGTLHLAVIPFTVHYYWCNTALCHTISLELPCHQHPSVATTT